MTAPLSFSPLTLSDVAARRAARLSGWPVRKGPAEAPAEVGRLREGQDPLSREATTELDGEVAGT